MHVTAPIVDIIKEHFVLGAKRGEVRDVAFLGSASNIYEWNPCKNAELDVLFLVDLYSQKSGKALLELSNRLEGILSKHGIGYEFRIVRGPYKKTPDAKSRTAVVVHAAVFSENDYKTEAPQLLRWSWRKYHCVVTSNALEKWAPERPSVTELIRGKLGIDDRVTNIEAELLVLSEMSLPDFVWHPLTVGREHNLFTEYCIAAVADTARNHGRVIGLVEADSLVNKDYFAFYRKCVFNSPEFEEAIRIKSVARETGYKGLQVEAERCALKYLADLRASLVNIKG